MTAGGSTYVIKARFHDERHWYFLGGDGGSLTRLKVRAGMTENRGKAEVVAAELLRENQGQLAATKVIAWPGGRVVARYGEPTPARPDPFDFTSYRYLVEVHRNRGYFHVKNDDGGWANVSEAEYLACRAEAERAGLDPGRLTIHGCTCTFQTRGLRFIQRSDRPT